MKKKIYAFLFVLASVIACTVCLAACDNGGASRAEYVGKYEFVSYNFEMSFDGGEPETDTIKVGDPNVDKDWLSLTLSEDGNYEMIMSPSYMSAVGAVGSDNGVLRGEWSVSGGKLNLAGSGNGDGIITENILTFTTKNSASYGGQTISSEIELKLKRVVEETPAE